MAEVMAENQAENYEGVMQRSKPLTCVILTLPTELLVCIFSFLSSARDKATIRCVSRRLRSVMETPSLWSEFMWPNYDRQEESCVINLIKSFGGHVKWLSFPDHVPRSEIFQYCENIVRLELSTHGTVQLSPNKLCKAVKRMRSLQKFDVYWAWSAAACSGLMHSLLAVCANIQELTIRVHDQTPHSSVKYLDLESAMHESLLDWAGRNFKPQNLNIVCRHDLTFIIERMVWLWPPSDLIIPLGCTGNLCLYTGFKVPLDVLPALPVLQVQFGQKVMFPYVDASKLRLVGVKNGLLMLNNHRSKVVWKRDENFKMFCGDRVSINLGSVVECDFSSISTFDHCNLDQLAAACPNLQRLNLSETRCLKHLQGLRSIANCCNNLLGLNLLGIKVKEVENHMQLWEILSSMKLTHLSIELCIVMPYEGGSAYEQKLIGLYLKCLLLKAIHLVHDKTFSCLNCKLHYCEKVALLSHFPSLTCCLLNEMPYRCGSVVENIVTNCKAIKYFRCCYFRGIRPGRAYPFIKFACHLQQLFIHSSQAQLSNGFMSTISAHGSLVHVLLHVALISQEGMVVLIMNSPNLLTLRVSVHAIFQTVIEKGPNDCYTLTCLSYGNVKAELEKRFSNMKLFRVDGFDFIHQPLAKENHKWEDLDLAITENLF